MSQPSEYERYPVYAATVSENVWFELFKEASGNQNFKTSWFTWFNLTLLVLAYPAISLLGFTDDPGELLRDLTQGMLIVLLVATIVFQWGIFLINYLGTFLEGTGLRGVGLSSLRLVDFSWALAFLLAVNLLILPLIAWGLNRIGMPLSGDLGLLIPTTPFGKFVWVVVSFTAGFCEEIAFRGYLMTRLRLVGKFRSWLIPSIVSALAFGICHAYQGIPGFIMLSIYGLLFSLLYIRTGRLWPCILAHSVQDVANLFFPH